MAFLGALDLGSNTIKIGILKANQKKEILFLAKEPSWGIRRGVIVDPEKVAQKIKILLEKSEKFLNFKVKEIICNINGSHLHVIPSKGVVAVSRADEEISQEDIERVIKAAQTFSLPSNKEILDVFPKEFIVDGEKGIKDPLGMKGVRLEVEILALCCFSPYLKNLTTLFSLIELDVLQVVPSALASAQAVLNSRQKELGVACLDIGAWTSNLAVFEEGDLLHLATFPVGSAHITNDIAIGLQTEIDIAEKIKKEFANCIFEKKGKGEKIEMPLNNKKEEKLVFSRKLLFKIVSARIAEIFSLVQKELKKIGKAKLLPAGLVITGGGAKLSNVAEFAKKQLKLPARIGYPKGIENLEKDPSLATLCGLLLKGFDFEKEKKEFKKGGFFSKIKKFFRIFLP